MNLCLVCTRANRDCPVWEPGRSTETCVEHRLTPPKERTALQQAMLNSERAKRSYYRRAKEVCRKLRERYREQVGRPLLIIRKPKYE